MFAWNHGGSNDAQLLNQAQIENGRKLAVGVDGGRFRLGIATGSNSSETGRNKQKKNGGSKQEKGKRSQGSLLALEMNGIDGDLEEVCRVTADVLDFN